MRGRRAGKDENRINQHVPVENHRKKESRSSANGLDAYARFAHRKPLGEYRGHPNLVLSALGYRIYLFDMASCVDCAWPPTNSIPRRSEIHFCMGGYSPNRFSISDDGIRFCVREWPCGDPLAWGQLGSLLKGIGRTYFLLDILLGSSHSNSGYFASGYYYLVHGLISS